MHPEKTKIVYCRSERFDEEKHENEKFDFLGYTFQTRWIKGSNGVFMKAFSPAVSKEACQRLRSKIKQIIKQNATASIEQLTVLINPIVRGWLNYYRVFFKSRADKEANYINFALVGWIRRKYKSVQKSRKKAWRKLVNWAKYNKGLFYHWQLGILPTSG